MQKQLGKIGTIRREIQGKACPFCGGYRYQLILHEACPGEKSNFAARCIQCYRPRHLDDGFWKNLVDIKMQIPTWLFAMPLAAWKRHKMRAQQSTQQKRRVIEMLTLSGAVRPSDVEFRYATSLEGDEVSTLTRSFAIPPSPDAEPPTPLQASYARLQARGVQWCEQLRLQESYAQLRERCVQTSDWLCAPESYARLWGRGQQLFHWLRRELTTSL